MAAVVAQSMLSSSIGPSKLGLRRPRCVAALHAPQSAKSKSLPLPKLQSILPLEDVVLTEQMMKGNQLGHKEGQGKSLITNKLLAILETAIDRADMHAIIGEQRNNWNHLLFNSINSVTLAASLMAGLAAVPAAEAALPLNLSSAILFISATGLMLLVNKIQPSQLVEEQRSAARLFKQLERSIRATLSAGVTQLGEADVEEAMERVLSLRKAYPLPLLPGMLEKFPQEVEPNKWWPKLRQRRQRGDGRNGWTSEMEEEMRGALRVLKVKDEEQYVRLGRLVLSINKFLAFTGPTMAGLAAFGAAASCIGGGHGSLPAVVGGALAALVNVLQHGGQVGMVFELFRNCAGFYRRLEEEIEFTLGEQEQMREHGELFEVKMALRLGRSVSELRQLASYASSASCEDEEIKEFAGKLF